MASFLPVAKSIVAVMLLGNFLIICHELGHYLVARLFDVQARRFTIGFGPALAHAVDRRGTVWRLSLLPLGGYVAFEREKESGNPRSYAARPPWTRIAITAAGPVANVLAAIGVFAVMLATSGEPAYLPIANFVVVGSAAEHSGIQAGDRIVAINDRPITTFEEMRPTLRSRAGKLVHLRIQRDGRILDFFVGLGAIQEGNRTIGVLGIHSSSPTRTVLMPVAAIIRAAGKTWEAVTDAVSGIAGILARGQGAKNLVGVVGIAQLTGQAADQGIPTILALVAVLSANLALMNLLPIPILDGGALVFCFAELVLRRPLSPHFQSAATRAGFALLATMFMLTTVHDLDEAGLFLWLIQL